MCNETEAQFSEALRYVPDHLKTQGMCSQAVRNNPAVFVLVPGYLKTEEACNKALEVDPWSLYHVPNRLTMQGICLKALKDDPSSLMFVLDWFVARGPLDVWYDDEYWYHHDEMIEWHEGYKKQKAQKTSVKEEFMLIAWDPSRYWNWCMSKDEKRWWK